jgi:hypothetical protein
MPTVLAAIVGPAACSARLCDGAGACAAAAVDITMTTIAVAREISFRFTFETPVFVDEYEKNPFSRPCWPV